MRMLATKQQPGNTWRLALKAALAAGVLASIIFAHGCHRHEDTELLTKWFSFGAGADPRGR